MISTFLVFSEFLDLFFFFLNAAKNRSHNKRFFLLIELGENGGEDMKFLKRVVRAHCFGVSPLYEFFASEILSSIVSPKPLKFWTKAASS